MYKKLIILLCFILLSINEVVIAVNFSQSTKFEYQQKITRIVNKAATYVNISASEKTWYINYFNKTLNGLEELRKDPNLPESVKNSACKDFYDEIDYMEKYLNNPTISDAQKIQKIKEAIKQILSAESEGKQIEEQDRIAEEKWRAEQEARVEAEKKRIYEWEEVRKKEKEEYKKRLSEEEAAQKKEQVKWVAKNSTVQEEAKRQEEIENIKKQCVVKVSGLCFNWPKFSSEEEAYFYKGSGDYWADANERCKANNMSLPTRDQLQIYYKYVVSEDPGAYAVGITQLWSSELDGKNSAYILQGYRTSIRWLSWPRHNYGVETMCVKPVDDNSPLSRFQDYYGILKSNRKW